MTPRDRLNELERKIDAAANAMRRALALIAAASNPQNEAEGHRQWLKARADWTTLTIEARTTAEAVREAEALGRKARFVIVNESEA